MEFTNEDVDKLAKEKVNAEDLLKPALIQARQRVSHFEYDALKHAFSIFRFDYYDKQPVQLEGLTCQDALQRVHPAYKEEWQQQMALLDEGVNPSVKIHTVMKCWECNEYRIKAIALFGLKLEQGRITHYTGTICDLTAEVFERQHLLRYQQKIDILNRRYGIGLWSYKPGSGLIHSDNSGACDVFHNISTDNILALADDRSYPQLRKRIEGMDRRELNCQPELLGVMHQDGFYHHHQLIPDVILNKKGEVVEYVFISRDVTDELQRDFIIKKFAKTMGSMMKMGGMKVYSYRPGSRQLVMDDGESGMQIAITVSELVAVYPTYLQQDLRHIFSTCDAGTAKQMQWTRQLQRGNDYIYKVTQVHLLPVRGADDQVEEYIFMLVDMTEAYQQKELLGLTQTVGGIGAWTYDPVLKKAQWSEQVFRILNVDFNPELKITYEEYMQYLDPEDRKEVMPIFHEHFVNGPDDFCLSYRLVPEMGHRLLEQHVRMVRNQNGEVVMVMGTLTDITERMQQQQEHERANKLLKMVMRSLPVLVALKDAEDDFRLVMVNEQHAHTFGCEPKDLVGKCHEDYLPAETAKRLFETDTKAMQADAEHPFVDVLPLALPDGSVHFFQCVKFPFELQGRHLLLAALNDVTDLHEAKVAAERNNKLKSAFLANMSHEIRTPLNAIVGFSEMIVDNVSPEDNEEFRTIISENAQHLLRLVQDVLDLAKLESGTMRFMAAPFDVMSALRQAVVTVTPVFAKRGLTVTTEGCDASLIVTQDVTRMMEVVNNFLTNAAKNTQQGGAVVRCVDTGKGTFRISVTDTGIGVPEDKRDEIFGRFVKLDGFKEGTGLGLSICRNITECLYGTIGVDSEVGKGSTFWAEFPIDGIAAGVPAAGAQA